MYIYDVEKSCIYGIWCIWSIPQKCANIDSFIIIIELKAVSIATILFQYMM